MGRRCVADFQGKSVALQAGCALQASPPNDVWSLSYWQSYSHAWHLCYISYAAIFDNHHTANSVANKSQAIHKWCAQSSNILVAEALLIKWYYSNHLYCNVWSHLCNLEQLINPHILLIPNSDFFYIIMNWKADPRIVQKIRLFFIRYAGEQNRTSSSPFSFSRG